MTEQAEQMRERVRSALRVLDLEPSALSIKIGRSKDYVRDFLNDRKRSIAADAMAAIQQLVDGRTGATPSPAPTAAPPATFVAQPRTFPLGARTLPVYYAVEGGAGAMVVSIEPVEHIERPTVLGEADGYAVLVVGESMEPAYEPGDKAIVHPRLPIVRNKDIILVRGEEHGQFEAMIKRLVRQTDTHWIVRQHNPPREFELSKAEWPKALRVVGRYTA